MNLTINEALKRGISAHKEGKLQEAERFYQAILKSQPLHPHANHNLGVLAVSVNKIEEALKFFKNAIKANPNIEQFWLSYINTFLKEKRFEDAKEIIEQFQKQGFSIEKLNISEIYQTNIDPSDTEIDEVLKLYQKKEYDDVESQALSLTERFPEHPFAWRVLGALFKETGRLIESLNAIQRSVQLSPEDTMAHYNLANTLKELGQFENALVSYKKAIALKPDFAKAYDRLGSLLQTLGKSNDAEICYKKYISLTPYETPMTKSMALTFFEAGEFQKSLNLFDSYNTPYSRSDALKCLYALGNTKEIYKRIENSSL